MPRGDECYLRVWMWDLTLLDIVLVGIAAGGNWSSSDVSGRHLHMPLRRAAQGYLEPQEESRALV